MSKPFITVRAKCGLFVMQRDDGSYGMTNWENATRFARMGDVKKAMKGAPITIGLRHTKHKSTPVDLSVPK